MKLSDLKTGMWVKLRDNNVYLVLKDYETCRYGKGMFINKINGFFSFSEYRDDLKHDNHEDYDIVQVLIPSGDAFVLDVNRLVPIWTRKEKPELPPELKSFFEMLDSRHKEYWIAKDIAGEVCLYQSKPVKYKDITWTGGSCTRIDFFMDKSYFDWLSWEDEEPWYIPDLMEEE